RKPATLDHRLAFAAFDLYVCVARGLIKRGALYPRHITEERSWIYTAVGTKTRFTARRLDGLGDENDDFYTNFNLQFVLLHEARGHARTAHRGLDRCLRR